MKNKLKSIEEHNKEIMSNLPKSGVACTCGAAELVHTGKFKDHPEQTNLQLAEVVCPVCMTKFEILKSKPPVLNIPHPVFPTIPTTPEPYWPNPGPYKPWITYYATRNTHTLFPG